MSTRGRKRKIQYAEVVAYAAAHPRTVQGEIATYFGITQSRVSHILRTAGVNGVNRGRPLTRKQGQSAEEFEWEQILHDYGLGMERGIRLANKRILYGYDPLKEVLADDSATSKSDS